MKAIEQFNGNTDVHTKFLDRGRTLYGSKWRGQKAYNDFFDEVKVFGFE